jgi:hypothetical protein
MLEWIPLGNQINKFNKDEVGPIEKNVLIAKLREN